LNKPRILVVYYREDDPGKNTSLKLIRKGFATLVKPFNIKGKPIVLNPFSNNYLIPKHREYVDKYGLIVVDASWRKLSIDKFINIKGIHLKLPPLIPGNPVNYGKPCILSSIEAVASSLYITHYFETYYELIKLYKWMKTFDDLNKELLEQYSRVNNQEELEKIIKQYWSKETPC